MVFFIRSLLYSTASWGEVWCSITDLSSTAVALLRFALGLGSRNRAMRECPEPWIFFSEKSFLMSSNLNRWGTINLTLFNSLCAAATSANNTEVVLTHLPQKWKIERGGVSVHAKIITLFLWAVVVLVQWSSCLPSTPMIQVWIPQKSTCSFYSVKAGLKELK